MLTTRLCLRAVLVSAFVGASVSSQAQRGGVEVLSSDPSVRQALEAIRRAEPDTIRTQIRLCEIAAPPFGEAPRAAAYADAMRSAGLVNVRIDAEGNVLGERPGRSDNPRLVLGAHLDTVFPADVPVRVTRDGDWLHGPGIGDNCRGLAVLLAVARAMSVAPVQTNGPITFVGTVGEEGLGDLRGVKALMGATLKGRVDRFVAVDGDRSAVTHVGVGSRRYRVTFRGPGGHSYDDFGRASPVNALGYAVAAIARLHVPTSPRTTYSVSRIGGGTSINSIATEAWMEVDLRSSDAAALSSLDTRFKAAVQRGLDDENGRQAGRQPLTVSVELVGNRPAGRTALGTPMVETAAAALRVLGLPLRLDEGSTDANLAMSLGVPSIAIGGGGSARDVHTSRESFNTTDSWKGSQLVLLLAVALAQ